MLADAILNILRRRRPGATCCPSEAPRLAFPTRWRDLMELTRQAGRALAAQGLIEITQRGTVLDPGAAFRGPIRLRLLLQQCMGGGRNCKALMCWAELAAAGWRSEGERRGGKSTGRRDCQRGAAPAAGSPNKTFAY